jgi:hypothetical protein
MEPEYWQRDSLLSGLLGCIAGIAACLLPFPRAGQALSNLAGPPGKGDSQDT